MPDTRDPVEVAIYGAEWVRCLAAESSDGYVYRSHAPTCHMYAELAVALWRQYTGKDLPIQDD